MIYIEYCLLLTVTNWSFAGKETISNDLKKFSKNFVKVYIFSGVILEKSCIFTNYSKILLLNLNQISIFQKNFIKFCKKSLKMEYLLIKICTFLKIFLTKNYFLWMSLNLIFENENFWFFHYPWRWDFRLFGKCLSRRNQKLKNFFSSLLNEIFKKYLLILVGHIFSENRMHPPPSLFDENLWIRNWNCLTKKLWGNKG